MKYEFLLFDADHTLLDTKLGEKNAVRATFAKFDLPNDDEHIARYSEINHSLWEMFGRGEIEKKDLLVKRFELYCNEIGLERDYDAMNAEFLYNFGNEANLFDGVLEMIEELSERYRLFIATNSVKYVQEKRFENCPIAPFFEKVFISDVIGHQKPSYEFFELATNEIEGFSKEKALMIGDSLISDIGGAIGFGIDTCFYNPAGKEVPADMDITYVIKDFDELLEILK